jgi:hypothetical protein
MATDSTGDVVRLDPWDLPPYLRTLEQAGTTEVVWNKEKLPLSEALVRAARLTPTSVVVVDGTTIYVAEPDHSPDDTPRITPIQLGPRRPR